MDLIVLLFDDFETLDVFGPVEVLGKLENAFKIHFVSLTGATTVSSQQVPIPTQNLKSFDPAAEYIFLLPGGQGTRAEVQNEEMLQAVKKLALHAKFTLAVCTGSALLAKAGVLDEKKATTNKRAFDWVCAQNKRVDWLKKARWVKDGNIYTSSGVSAGIDMALGFIADNYGMETAETIAHRIEYIWNKDSQNDIFAPTS
ncbi:MAG: DJ-1/PfpI family protein [Sporomusaceae bacterium]|jgi:putative intracellular protease/amidase|nr:DJ-1/PfpI family protein [Sporomusaceae bacterium]